MLDVNQLLFILLFMFISAFAQVGTGMGANVCFFDCGRFPGMYSIFRLDGGWLATVIFLLDVTRGAAVALMIVGLDTHNDGLVIAISMAAASIMLSSVWKWSFFQSRQLGAGAFVVFLVSATSFLAAGFEFGDVSATTARDANGTAAFGLLLFVGFMDLYFVFQGIDAYWHYKPGSAPEHASDVEGQCLLQERLHAPTDKKSRRRHEHPDRIQVYDS